MPRTSFSEHGEQSWLELTVTLPAGYADDLSAHLIELGSRGTSEQSAAGAPGLCKVTAYFPASADRARLLKKASAFRDRIAASSPEAAQHFQTQAALIPDRDWNAVWKSYYSPTKISDRLVVKPSWQPYQPLGNEIVIELDPGMAFGTGTHQTTRLCLQAIEHCIGAFGSTKGLSLLDVGTGSGILAIAAALLGIPSAAGVDNDPLAVKSAQENARKNGVGDRIVLSTAPAAQISETFPIVAANILPHVLIAMREALAARVQSPGFLILSGIITEKASEVADAFSGELNLYRSMQEDEWVCLLFTKGAPDRARGPA